MNRELSIDASHVSLGDNSLLTLELSAEGPGGLLQPALKAAGGIILLSFDNLTTDHEPLKFHFVYSIDGTKLKVRQQDGESPKGQALFNRIKLKSESVSLLNKQSVDIIWSLVEWDEAGTYLVKGDVDGEKQDFGPVKLVVMNGEADQPVRVTLGEAKREETNDQPLWSLIRHRTIDFNRYRGFIDSVLCVNNGAQANGGQLAGGRMFVPFNRLASYAMLKSATELYLMQEAGLALEHDPGGSGNLNTLPRRYDSGESRRLGGFSFSASELREEYLEQLENEEGKVLPYFKLIREKLSEVPLKEVPDLGPLGTDVCYGILKSKLQAPPLMELIWSYWHEEGGLVQTMNAISLRFQNVRQGGPGQDPLANLNLDPLRPLNNLFWGYIEDERFRLSMNRRNLEYRYEYGFGLIGRGIQDIPVAESRAFFLRGFHSLLRAATEFYQQANFTTVIPDGFPILNHLREVHLTLAEGAHNQYGDLPWTARSEMLVQQWLLARPEVREFLGGRIMVPYTEPWMDRVDNMKQLQGWNPANISHFHDLGTFGEQLLLSIRYGSWNSPGVGATNAANWAYYWREEIQRYIHAYKAVTGVDLASDIVDARLNTPDNEERYLQPAQLIERQTAMQHQQLRRRGQLAPARVNALAPNLPQGVPVPRRNGLPG
ncbi:hypothetical protein [Hymenobacter chitinivorans]|uniref:8-amino-7-oxononanoate synthase n=1 Tax=Hymenobacter chitinivorans DSM 11115 TaxID=1121954 RepID=A0A2M9BQE4_9BACT|nr:hypothetical protein [Hymenobacter chitinivorans]PJJ60171.1 hypothetical protein CLV45_1596 [Hymenobacter chitinivorans DSM 11115]